MLTGVGALHAQLHQIPKGVRNEGVTPRAGRAWTSFRELPGGGTGQNRIACGVTGAAHTRAITTHG